MTKKLVTLFNADKKMTNRIKAFETFKFQLFSLEHAEFFDFVPFWRKNYDWLETTKYQFFTITSSKISHDLLYDLIWKLKLDDNGTNYCSYIKIVAEENICLRNNKPYEHCKVLIKKCLVRYEEYVNDSINEKQLKLRHTVIKKLTELMFEDYDNLKHFMCLVSKKFRCEYIRLVIAKFYLSSVQYKDNKKYSYQEFLEKKQKSLILYHRNCYLLSRTSIEDCYYSINIESFDFDSFELCEKAANYVLEFADHDKELDFEIYVKFFSEIYQSLFSDYIKYANNNPMKFTVSIFFENLIYYSDMRAVINMLEKFFISSECEHSNIVKRHHTDSNGEDFSAAKRLKQTSCVFSH
ncbi:hypothetical protein COBT_002924 [Conglomerata obtusa]